MKPWRTQKLGELCDVKGGKRLPEGANFSEEGYPYLRARDIRNGRISFDEPVYIDEKLRSKLKRYRVRKNDICITIVGVNIGDVGIVPDHLDDANLTENVAKLTNLQNISPYFLNHYLRTKSVRELMQLFASGSAQGKLGLYKIKQLPVPIPPLSVQRKIAAILSAHDELIENNQRRIALLEKLAEEIYREWFVRLRFPGHEKVKKIKGVPDGWEIRKLSSILELCYGKALKDDDRIPGEYPVYGSSGIVGTHNEALVKTPGLIVGRKGNVGSVHWSDSAFFPIDTVYFVKSELPNSFLHFLLRSMNFINNDVAVPGLNRNQAYSNQFFLPPVSLINKYAEIADPQFEMKRVLRRENENLTIIRDKLLPRLISGKLSVENLDIQFPPGMAEESIEER